MARGKAAGGAEHAGAKVNLALHVGQRRADGHHNIETLVVFADFGDFLRATPAAVHRVALSVEGPFASALTRSTDPHDNLVVRAAEALMGAVGGRELAPVGLALTKRLPVAAGLGGGSADAAATLRLLDRQWDLHLGEDKLREIGQNLGADVPMAVVSRPVVARGMGERLAPARGMPALAMVLACPAVALSTAAVFGTLGAGARAPLPPLPTGFASAGDLIQWLRQTHNDLAAPATKICGEAGAAATALAAERDCLFARMSGSGAAAFGIFTSPAAAKQVAERLRVAQPDWWVVSALTGGS